MWVNVDEHHGVPSQGRPDTSPPRHWRLEAVAAVGRPHDLAISVDAAEVAFVLDSGDTSDIWAMGVDGTGLRRLTTDRPPHPYWEDTAPAWSPDGRRVAYAADGCVWIVPAAGGPPRRLVEGGSPRWLDGDRLLISVDRDRVSRLCVVAADDPWPQAVSPDSGSVGAVSIDGRRVAYVLAPRDDRTRSDLVVTDLDTGTTSVLCSTPGFFTRHPAFSPDGSSIVFASERSGWSELHLVAEGSERPLTDQQADFSYPRWSGDGRSILAVRTRHARDDLVSVDPASGDVEVIAPGGTWSDPHWTGHGGVIAVHEDHRTPPRVTVLTREAKQTTALAAVPAAIAVAPHVSPEAVAFPSFDGLEIPGLLFRPVGDGPRPVVVYPHGGPTSHYGDEWDGVAQFFLDKGYGWFAVNFRGSTGYGLRFEHSEHGRWGVDDTEDCLAAADHLAGLDWVDPARIAIFGASYGAYLAVAALARDPRHRFACAVAKYGDCDILTSWAQGDRGGREDLERMMGHPGHDRQAYRDGSPVHRAAAIARPLLIGHGELDERVSLRQSEELVGALRAHGKTFEYVTYPTEAHGLLRRGPQLHFYRRMERFLDWYLM